MKKVYEKPQVYMERFELAEHIAACGLKINHDDGYSCSVVDDREGYGMVGAFATGTEACKNYPVESYCYGGQPTQTFAIFQS